MAMLKRRMPRYSYFGIKWRTNQTNKKYLAIDFNNRCAYCDDADRYNGGFRYYHVDHFAPASRFPELKYTYENLLYTCPYCNEAKSNTWVSEDASVSVINDSGFLSPCDAEYYNHLSRNEDGTISATSSLGEYMRKHLKLYLKRHSIIYLLEQVEEKCDTLESLIKEQESNGKDVTKLRLAYSSIAMKLREYYKLFYNNLKETG